MDRDLDGFVRLPADMEDWHIWALSDECFKLYLTLILKAFDPEHRSPARGMVEGSIADLAGVALLSVCVTGRAMRELAEHGYIHDATVCDGKPTWAIACPEYFDPEQPEPAEAIDPAKLAR